MPLQPVDLSKLLENVPPGAWAAISHDESRVIAFSADINEAVTKAKDSGEPDPILIRVPEKSAALML